jgi:hypothetical protein
LKPGLSYIVFNYMTSRLRSGPLALCLSIPFLAAGCQRDGSGALYERWDSGGIEIVESHFPSWGEHDGWTIDFDPVLDLGGPDGPPEAQFYMITGAVVLPDGRIVIGHRGTNELLFFSSEGTFLEAHGGEGGGPGEFWGLYRLWLLRPDSLVVYDDLERRVSIFDAGGRFIRSWKPQLPGGELVRFTPVSLMGDGSVMLGTRPRGWEIPRGASRDSLVLRRFDREGSHLDSIGVFPWRERYRPIPKQTGNYSSATWIASQPFGRNARSGPYQDGFFIGRSEVYEVEAYSPGGGLQRLIRQPVTNRPVASQDISALKRDWLGDDAEDWMRSDYGKWVATMDFPETMPPYGPIKEDLEGNLWVWHYDPPGNPVDSVTVFDPDGRMLGTIPTPQSLVVFQIGADYLLSFTRDEMDREHIQLFRIKKG